MGQVHCSVEGVGVPETWREVCHPEITTSVEETFVQVEPRVDPSSSSTSKTRHKLIDDEVLLHTAQPYSPVPPELCADWLLEEVADLPPTSGIGRVGFAYDEEEGQILSERNLLRSIDQAMDERKLLQSDAKRKERLGLSRAACPQEAEDVELDDGAKYRGQWSDNQINGYGVLTKPDGASYEGFFVNGLMQGHGVLFYINGNTYEGEWVDDQRHGYGKYVCLKVGIYEGEWHHDQKSGEGNEEWTDGASYVGEYLQNCKHGLGTYLSGTGVCYKGQFQCDKMHGYGSYTFADKRTYVGQWTNGHMNGVGEMKWPNGSKYEGSYTEDVKSGEGTFTWPDGRTYSGQWQNGKPDGQGVMTGADDVSIPGEWKLGKRVSKRSHSAKRGGINASLDCDVVGRVLMKGSHVNVHGRSGVVGTSPDSDGCCTVIFDVDNTVSETLKCNQIAKIPLAIGNHVVYDGCNGVIVLGPDEDGNFQVKSSMDGNTSGLLNESQLTWATLQPKYLLPPDRVTHGAATRILYHKTARGDEIRLSGKMLRGRGGAVGGGIYFAASVQDCNRKAKSRGWIVKAKVLLGRHMIVKMSSQPPSYNFWQLYNAGFDSVELRGFASGTEYVVFSKDQVQILDVFKEA